MNLFYPDENPNLPKTADQQYNIGWEFYYNQKRQDYTTAAFWFKKAAERGVLPAQVLLGICYYWGKGVEEDGNKAYFWLKKGAERLDMHAMYYLGECYRQGFGTKKDPDAAFLWYSRAAEKHRAFDKVYLRLGEAYMNGWGTPKDPILAVTYWDKAAALGIAAAQKELGFYFEHAIGTFHNAAKAFQYYKQASDGGDLDAKFWMARHYLLYKDIPNYRDEVFQLLSYAAERGHRESQVELAKQWEEGLRGEIKKREAMHWYRMAAEQGDLRSQYNLALYYYFGSANIKDYEQAFFWFQRAASRGDTDSKLHLAEMYWEGKGTSQNYTEAVKLYQELLAQQCYQGSVSCRLGLAYYYGNGVRRDYKTARKHFLFACRFPACAAEAHYILGRCYAKGRGCPINFGAAFNAYLAAAKESNYHHANAMYELGRCYEFGYGTEEDWFEASIWYHRAVDEGNAKAARHLGHNYYIKTFLSDNLARANAHFHLAADLGDADSQFWLASQYRTGTDMPKDEELAAFFYRRAAKQGHLEAICELGRCYLYGNGVAKDETKAVECFAAAAKRGRIHPDAAAFSFAAPSFRKNQACSPPKDIHVFPKRCTCFGENIPMFCEKDVHLLATRSPRLARWSAFPLFSPPKAEKRTGAWPFAAFVLNSHPNPIARKSI